MAGLRVAIFTHDTFGLGHVRRSLHFARALADQDSKSAILLVTGSPALHAFGALPQNVDVVKIPTIARTGEKSLRPPHLPLGLEDITRMRSRLVEETLLCFGPDVFLVDNFPLGSRRELLPVLQTLRQGQTRTVLGLRDILDDPEAVRADWDRQGMYSVLEDLYDRILIYGSREVLDVVPAYAIPPAAERKLVYCGYVTAPDSTFANVGPASLGMSGPFLLATGGGGGDGFPLLKAVAEAAPRVHLDSVLIVTGPLMNASLREDIQNTIGDRSGVVIRDFVPGLSNYMAAARIVVSMCGYNTAAEIISRKASALVVPRTWKYGEHRRGDPAGVEGEQRIRAESLARLGLVRWMDPGELTPERLAERINAILAAPARQDGIQMDLNGVQAVTKELLSLAGDSNGAHQP